MALPPSAPDIRVGDLVTWVGPVSLWPAETGIVLKVVTCQQDLIGTGMDRVTLTFSPDKPCFFVFDNRSNKVGFLAGIKVELVSR